MLPDAGWLVCRIFSRLTLPGPSIAGGPFPDSRAMCSVRLRDQRSSVCRKNPSHWVAMDFLCQLSLLESAKFSPISSAENIQSIKVLSLGNEFRKVMAVGVSQEKFGKGIA